MHPVVHQIDKLRRAKGLQKGQLAKCVGRSAAWYSKLLRGDKVPNADHITAIANALGVEPGVFFKHQLDESESRSGA
ncbi:MAG: helix-turn-helix domain-containing protein [Alicyclobacillus sp.]|nr:helix-turn-helix domain-containing protein [Alicyclobacillus sp.]